MKQIKFIFLTLFLIISIQNCGLADSITIAPEPTTTPIPSKECPICTDIDGNLIKDCLIKGNINNKGEHIYNCPKWRDYDKTIIDESLGERWFCTEIEAVNAGWRKPKYKTGICR